jgi:Tfp pilus assembly protein PilF
VAVAVVLAVAAGAGLLVARSAGQRTAGEQITGSAGGADTATLLARARASLGVDPRAAQDLYTKVLDDDPNNVEALTYSGWLLYIASGGAGAELRTAAVDTAKEQMTKAIAVDATYPDPHCFLAIIADQAGDAATATAESGRCLALDPPAEVRDLMQSLTS